MSIPVLLLFVGNVVLMISIVVYTRRSRKEMAKAEVFVSNARGMLSTTTAVRLLFMQLVFLLTCLVSALSSLIDGRWVVYWLVLPALQPALNSVFSNYGRLCRLVERTSLTLHSRDRAEEIKELP